MIRLSVVDREEAGWQQLAPRLRDAAVHLARDVAALYDTLPDWDAAIVLDMRCADGPIVDRCLRAAKHVLVAAELCPTREMLDAFADAAQARGARLTLANPDRYLPSRQLIRQHLDAGKLGKPGLLRLHRWEPGQAADEPQRLPAHLLRDLDSAVDYFGAPADVVFASASGTSLQVHLGFPGGGMALIDLSRGLPGEAAYGALSLIGSAGAAYADDHQNMQLEYAAGGPRALRTDEDRLHRASLAQDFVNALQASGDDAARIAAWRHVLAVAAAVQQSLGTRKAVPLEGLA